MKSSISNIKNGLLKLIEKIKAFIKNMFKPILKVFDNVSDEENNMEIINALRNVGINVSGNTDGKTKYSPLIYKKTDDGKHTLKSLILMSLENINGIPDIYAIEKSLTEHRNLVKDSNTNEIKSIFSQQQRDSNIYENWVIEDYVDRCYRVLDICKNLHADVLSNEGISEDDRSVILNQILIFSNQINMFLVQMHNAVSVRLDPVTKSVVNQFKGIDHIVRFVKEYIKSPKLNYNALKKVLMKIFKLSKYKYGSGSSRIYIPDPDDSSSGYKFATNTKGIIDNRMEYRVWNKISDTKLSEYFVPITEIDDSGIIVKCKKANDIGKVNKSAALQMISSIKSIQKSQKSRDLLNAKFDVDIFIRPYEFIATKDSMYNAGNVGTINHKPVIIDYANIFI